MKPVPDKSDLIKLDVQNLVELPAVSPIIPQLLDAVSNDDISIRDLAEIIRQDTSLIARITGLANSAYFGQREPITKVEDAIFKALGMSLTKSIALSIALVGSFRNKINCQAFSLRDFWLIAVLTATLARDLSAHTKNVPPISADDAYLAGILHDLGILPLLFLYPDAVCEAFKNRNEENDLRSQLRHTLGTDHHEVGYWLASKWQIPNNITSAIAHYADIDYEVDNYSLARLIQASRLCGLHYLHSGDWQQIPDISLLIFSRLGVDEDSVRNALKKMQDKYTALESVVDVLSLE